MIGDERSLTRRISIRVGATFDTVDAERIRASIRRRTGAPPRARGEGDNA